MSLRTSAVATAISAMGYNLTPPALASSVRLATPDVTPTSVLRWVLVSSVSFIALAGLGQRRLRQQVMGLSIQGNFPVLLILALIAGVLVDRGWSAAGLFALFAAPQFVGAAAVLVIARLGAARFRRGSARS